MPVFPSSKVEVAPIINHASLMIPKINGIPTFPPNVEAMREIMVVVVQEIPTILNIPLTIFRIPKMAEAEVSQFTGHQMAGQTMCPCGQRHVHNMANTISKIMFPAKDSPHGNPAIA